MTISMPTESLEPGMVLAEPIFNRLGQILLTKGSKLSNRHITVLKTWGVQSASIDNGEPEAGDPLLDEEIRNRAWSRIQKRLLWTPKNPIEEEIIALAIQQFAKRSLLTN